MAGESFVIEELTGSRRRVELKDRALPHKPVGWPGQQRIERTDYPGNPVATLQVLGPVEGDLEIKGKWQDRYVGSAAVLTGWDSYVEDGAKLTAEDLVSVFQALRVAGNHVEVRWGARVVRGVMKDFSPHYDRTDKVVWSATFEISQRGRNETPRAASAAASPSGLSSAERALAFIIASAPPGLITAVMDEMLSLSAEIQAAVVTMIEAVADVSGQPEVTMEQYQDVASKAVGVTMPCEALRRLLGDVPVTGLLPTDDVATILPGGAWAQEAASSCRSLAGAAIVLRDGVRDRTVPGYMADVRLRDNQTLRTLALEHYGSADDWPILADANGLVGSVHPSGTRVLVPRRNRSGGRAA